MSCYQTSSTTKYVVWAAEVLAPGIQEEDLALELDLHYHQRLELGSRRNQLHCQGFIAVVVVEQQADLSQFTQQQSAHFKQQFRDSQQHHLIEAALEIGQDFADQLLHFGALEIGTH